MKSIAVISCYFLLSVFGVPAVGQSTPKLIIVMIVDQMRGDYLERYRRHFQFGLHRLQSEGVIFQQAYHAHAFTGTAPGHATLSTGMHPATHGVMENSFYDRDGGAKSYAINDSETKILGTDAPGVSPKVLLAPTLGDLVQTRFPASRVYAVALKDRASVLMGGKKATGAYWYNSQGSFVTSDYYTEEYPQWVLNFNTDTTYLSEIYQEGWQQSKEPSQYTRSRQDAFPQEAIQWGFSKNHVWGTTFPHRFDNLTAPKQYLKPIFFNLIWRTPFADEMTLRFTRRLVEHERLGQGNATDLLFVGLSACDALGHGFGPRSREMEDYFIKLDEYLGNFLDFLDTTIGRDGYLLSLSSDHGVMPMPEELRQQGRPAVRVVTEEFQEEVKNVGRAWADSLETSEQPFKHIDFEGVVLNDELLSQAHPNKTREVLAKKLKSLDFIAETYTWDELKAGQARGDKPYFDRYQKTFFAPRSQDILFQYKPNYLVAMGETGTSHGSPYPYDSHVPLIFWSDKMEAKIVSDTVYTVDLTPTLLDLLSIPVERTFDGRSLKAHLTDRN